MANLDLATLSVLITADASPAEKIFKDVGETSSQQAQKVKNDWKETGEALTSLGKTLSLSISAPLTAAGVASVKLASDLTETLGKTEIVFGNLSDTVIAWSETSVESMGLAQETALNMASTYGDLGTAMGLSVDEAANMSMSLVKLGADMASFKNISIERANVALQAIYTGETESLKAMGIVMTEANLEQFAMAQGCEKTYKSMSQTEKVMLRYKYVMSMTTNAQGDFVRTGDSLANQSRKLGENIKQLGAPFGKTLEPSITSAINTINGLVSWINGLDDGVKRVITTVGETVAAVPVIITAIGGVITVVDKLKAAFVGLMANPVAAWITGITVAITALVSISSAMSGVSQEIDKTTDTYKRFSEAFDEEVKARVDTSELDKLENREVNVKVDADTSRAEEKAQFMATAFDDMEGTITVNGDTSKAEEAIGRFKNSVDKDVEIKAVAYVDVNDSEWNKTKSEIEDTTHYTYANIKESPDYETTRQSIIARAKELAGEYTAIGKFVVDDTSQEGLEEYQKLLAEATTATENCDEIVGNLDAWVERQAAIKKTAVYTKLLQQSEAELALYEAGIIDENTYNERMAALAAEAQKASGAIDGITENLKELNATFNDGIPDIERWGEIYKNNNEITGEATIANEQYNASLAALMDRNASITDAQIVYYGLLQEQEAQTKAMTEAQEGYNQQLSDAKQNYEETVALQEESANYAEDLSEAYSLMGGVFFTTKEASFALNKTLEEYPALAGELIKQTGASVNELEPYSEVAKKAGENNETMKAAIDAVATGMENGLSPTEALIAAMEKYPEVASELPSILQATWTTTTEDFYATANELYNASEEKQKEAHEALKQAETDYQAEQEQAKTDYLNKLSQIQSDNNTKDKTAIISHLNEMGVIQNEADADKILNTQSTVDKVVKIVNEGGSDAVNKVDDALSEMNTHISSSAPEAEAAGKSVGGGMGSGIHSGLDSWLSRIKSKARQIVKEAMNAARREADIHSPSRKTRDLIGKPFAQGIEEGIEDYTPNLLRSTRNSMNAIITAGTGTVNSNYKLQPANTTNVAHTTINQTNNFTSRTLSPYEQQTQIKRLNKDLAGVFA